MKRCVVNVMDKTRISQVNEGTYQQMAPNPWYTGGQDVWMHLSQNETSK